MIQTKEQFDEYGPLFAPRFRSESAGPVRVLIDSERAHWVSVNEAGERLLQHADGRTAGEILDAEEPLALPRRTRRFLKTAARRGFLRNQPFAPEIYQGRRDRLQQKLLHEFWVLTNDDCNLRCKHCYTIDRVIQGDPGLPAETLKGIIDDARELGSEVFYFTGGEPFRRKDILELIDHVASRSKLILFTNGTLFTPELVKKLHPYRERLIFQISLDGDGEEHTRFVRGKTAFDRAWAGMELLLGAGLRVGVSSTPTGAVYRSIPDLTERLARLDVGGRRVEYHHLIMLLDQGGAVDNVERMGIRHDQFAEVLQECRRRIKVVKKQDSGCRIVLANDKMFKALATNGPRKDLCGAGYTILGMTADGELHPCAATINDATHHCGRLVEDDRSYRKGRLQHLYWNSEHLEQIRNFTLARQNGEDPADLRYFHGGGCWYNMTDPTRPFSSAHPFAEVYEHVTLAEIQAAAQKGVEEVSDTTPQLYNYMHRRRIACAGPRKTEEVGRGDVDNGYCICFA